MRTLSDQEIAALIADEKKIPPGLSPLGKMTERCQHKRKDFDVQADSGNEFVVRVRQSSLNVLDFSVILGYKLPGSYTVFRLRRYNGSSHQHTNVIERQTLDGFHIHAATERYQQLGGAKEDHYAEKTDRYYHLDSAIQCMLAECGFRSPVEDSPLFRGEL
jgi:hypothetical protein